MTAREGEKPGTVAAVLLDAGGVLVLPDRNRVAAAYAAAGVVIDPERVSRAHYLAGRVLDRFASGDGSALEYANEFARALGVPPARRDAAVAAHLALFSAPANGRPLWSEPVPGTREGLDALRRRGIAVAIVTNSDGNAAANLAAAGICQTGEGDGARVAAVVDSHLVGSAKPEREIFEAALRRVGVPSQCALHVGDRIAADIKGARGAGIRAVHFDPFRTCRERDHAHARTLRGVARHLGGPA